MPSIGQALQCWPGDNDTNGTYDHILLGKRRVTNCSGSVSHRVTLACTMWKAPPKSHFFTVLALLIVTGGVSGGMLVGYPFGNEPVSPDPSAAIPRDTGHGTMPLEVQNMNELAGLRIHSQDIGSSDHSAPALQRAVNAREYTVDTIRIKN